MHFGGVPPAPGKAMVSEPLPAWLASLSKRLVHEGVFEEAQAPNHVLVNEYTPGECETNWTGQAYMACHLLCSFLYHAICCTCVMYV